MPINKIDIPKRVNNEKNRLVRMRDFLKENAEQAYTADELSELTGIKCSGEMLRWRYREKARALGIKSVELIHDQSRYCGSETYYFYGSQAPPYKTEWYEFWKKKKPATKGE